MSREQAGKHYADVAAADCNSKCGLRLQPRSTASLWVPGSVLLNTPPSYRDTEQQIGLKAKSVPKGSFTTAEGSCFEKDVQDKKQDSLRRHGNLPESVFPFRFSYWGFFPLCSIVLSFGVELRA